MIDETIKVLKIENRAIKMGLTMQEGAVGIDELNLQISEQEVFRYLKLTNQEIPRW